MSVNPKNLGNFTTGSGSTSSVATLDGTLSVNNVNFNFPTIQGINNSYLSNNGNGITSWIVPSLNALLDTNLTSSINNQLLSYDGSLWINKTLTKNDIGLSNVDNLSASSILNNSTLTGTTTISGNLVVNGTTTTVNSTNSNLSDNILTLNNGEIGAGITLLTAGIQIDRGTLPDYQIIFDETSQTFQIGEIGSLQKVATRETTPTNNAIPIWNSTTNMFDTNLGLSSSITNQLKNIEASTISNTQWNYLSTMNQSLSTTSSPTFLNATMNGTITLNSRALTFPVNTGSNGNVLSTNGSGILSWSSGVTSTLLGLSDVNILTPLNTNFLKYHTASSKWINSNITPSDVGLSALSLDSTNVVFTAGIKIGNQTLYFPTDTGSASNVLSTNGSGVLSWNKAILHNGNELGENLILGTIDAHNIEIKIDNTTKMIITDTGIDLSNFMGIKFKASNNNTVNIIPPATINTSYDLLLPNDQGLNGTSLINDGSGNLTWGSGASAAKLENPNDVTTIAQISGKRFQTVSNDIITSENTEKNMTLFNNYGNACLHIPKDDIPNYVTTIVDPTNGTDFADLYDNDSLNYWGVNCRVEGSIDGFMLMPGPNNNGIEGIAALNVVIYDGPNESGNIVYSGVATNFTGWASYNTNFEYYNINDEPITFNNPRYFGQVTFAFTTPIILPSQGDLYSFKFYKFGATGDNMAYINVHANNMPYSFGPASTTLNKGPWFRIAQTNMATKQLRVSGAISISPTFKVDGYTPQILLKCPSQFNNSYTIQLPGSQGANNTYLKNNGYGVTSWSTIDSPIKIVNNTQSIEFPSPYTMNVNIQNNLSMKLTSNVYNICNGREQSANIYFGDSWFDISSTEALTITGFIFYRNDYQTDVNDGDIFYSFDVYDITGGLTGGGNILYSVNAISDTILGSGFVGAGGEVLTTLNTPIVLPANTVYSLEITATLTNNIIGTNDPLYLPAGLFAGNNFPNNATRFYPYLKMRIGQTTTITTLYNELELKNSGTLKLHNKNNNGNLQIKTNTTSDYTLIFPNGQGGNGTTLINNGSGNLSWGTITSTLATLTDVNILAPLNTNFLKYDTSSSKWINHTLTPSDAGLAPLSVSGSDVLFSAGLNINGNLLTFPSNTGTSGNVLSTNGSGVLSWTTAASAISNLTDVTLTSVANGQLLKYNTGTSKWLNTLLSSSDVGLSALSTTNSMIQVTNSNIAMTVKTITATSVTLDATGYLWRYTGTATASFIIPLAASFSGVSYLIANESNFAITVQTSGSDTLDGSIQSIQLNNKYDRINVVSNGNSVWYIQ